LDQLDLPEKQNTSSDLQALPVHKATPAPKETREMLAHRALLASPDSKEILALTEPKDLKD
jgi:hypothetical protein